MDENEMNNEAQAKAEEDSAVKPEITEAEGEMDGELAKMRDELLRALAEVENTRRRGERQAQEARAYAIDRFARDILPVADTLARALASAPPRDALDDATRTLIAGVEMTEKALIEAFGRHGLRRTGAKGEAFDPNLHQAMAQAPSDAPAGTVSEVMQPGYVLGERTLRPALVVVSAGPPATPPPAGSSEHIDIKV
jgi:molecular chaperone GrpE